MKLKILNQPIKEKKTEVFLSLVRSTKANGVRLVACNEEGTVLNNVITIYDNGTYYLHSIQNKICRRLLQTDSNNKIMTNDFKYKR